MSIFDMFKSSPAQQSQQAAPQQPQGGLHGVPTVTPEPNNPTAPQSAPPMPASPLAEFNNLWDTDPNKKPTSSASNKPLNPADVQAAVSKTDFSSVLTPDLLAAIANGGEEAQKAYAQSMNLIAQKVMVDSTLVNNKLNEQLVAAARKEFQDSLPAMLRQQTSSDHLKTSNPLFSNPAIKPVIEATQAQLLQKFPNATPAEITEMTQKYVIAMGESFAPKATTNSNGAGDVDWSTFLN